MKLPKELLYNKDYSWVSIKDNTAIVGVIEPAAKKVKEFVFINLPKTGKNIKKGETYVSLEAVKWSGHLSSPVTGEIVEVNKGLFDEPSQINKNPYKNWIMKVEMKDKVKNQDLIKSDEAEKFYRKKI